MRTFLRTLLCVPALASALLAAGVAAQSPADEVAYSDSSAGRLRVTTLARGLNHPWALCFLPDGRALVSERAGRLRYFDPKTRALSAPISGLPTVWASGQGGLLDVALDPDFHRNQRIWFSYAEGGSGGRAGTAVARARLAGNALQEVRVMFRQDPKLSTGNHFGSRIVFDGNGHVFIVLGENNDRPTAQYLDHHQGKVVRLNVDGTVPDDNPFVDDDDALIDIWSTGHRNPQGAALNPWTQQLWLVEHGPMGGDELNVAQAGRNYGWPIITYGIDYNGQPIPESTGTSAPGMEQPLHYWVPSIATSGLAFFNSRAIPTWTGDAFVGGLVARQLVRIDLDAQQRVLGEERLLGEFNWRIRDVRVGPAGALYLLTDDVDGRIVRIELDKRPPPIRIPGPETPMPKNPPRN